jgi:hypothetical protein
MFSVAEALERERIEGQADELQRQLGYLAFRMIVNGQFGALDRPRAAAWLVQDDDHGPLDLAAATAVWRAAEASSDCLTRYGAAFQLAYREWREAIVALVEALRDSDRRIRWGAAYWLGALRDERGIAPLIAALGDPDSYVRENAARALVNYGSVVTPAVTTAFGADDANVRVQAASILGYIGVPQIVSRLATALGDPSSDVRGAAYALGGSSTHGKSRISTPLRSSRRSALRSTTCSRPAASPATRLSKSLRRSTWDKPSTY